MRPTPLRPHFSLSAAALAALCLCAASLIPPAAASPATAAFAPVRHPLDVLHPVVSGPIVHAPVAPVSSGVALRDMPQVERTAPRAPVSLPLRRTPSLGQPSSPAGQDPVLQGWGGRTPMPAPLISFEGLDLSHYGFAYPPDTVGDVNGAYFVQAVNTSLGVFRKSDGALVNGVSFNDFFNGTGSPCDYANFGDVLAVYDRLAQRWIVSDLAIPRPYYECIAVSQTDDPTGKWNMYAILISGTEMNDYPKMGVWNDAYTFTFNMFDGLSQYFTGVQVWAFDKADLLAGDPVRSVSFILQADQGYASLLPAHALSRPATREPQYLASVALPDQLQLWKLDFNPTNPVSSTLTGPTGLSVAPFFPASGVAQPGTIQTLDSLSYRPMMQLQYRRLQGAPSLWLNHTVASAGLAAPRWYEVGDPGGTPFIAQQGTYQPDRKERWMGSLAVDKDGNLALGYSLGGASLYPSIAYSGRLYGELPGALTQGERMLIQGGAAQTVNDRWGDYSAMSVDPADDCTFWYTNEYYPANNGWNWHTRIGAFRFPSCGQIKGLLSGVVKDATSSAPLPGVSVVAASPLESSSTRTNASGAYSMTLMSGTYQVTAGPLLPGYSQAATVSGVVMIAPKTKNLDILLQPSAHLVFGDLNVIDPEAPYGNLNGFPEPGEQGLSLMVDLANDGLAGSGPVSATLSSREPGVVINNAQASYTDIPPGQTHHSLAPYTFSLRSTAPCGAALSFTQTLTTTQGVSQVPLSLVAGFPHPVMQVYSNPVTSSVDLGGWTTGGINNTWTVVTNTVHSAPYAWGTNQPPASYPNEANSYLKSPTYDLTGMHKVQLSAWVNYDLEAGYDFVYLEYSLDGGLTWSSSKLAAYNGVSDWQLSQVSAPMLDDQPSVTIRYRLVSDEYVTGTGFFVDDLAMSAWPFTCSFSASLPESPILQEPGQGGFSSVPAKFAWGPGGGPAVPVTYTLRVDGSVVTTTLSTAYTLDLPLGRHTWGVTAANAVGSSLPAVDWSFVAPRLWYMPLVR